MVAMIGVWNAFDDVISSGLMHEDLQTFLLNNVPQGKKKSKVTLGVGDPKLGSVIYETLSIHCQTGKCV